MIQIFHIAAAPFQERRGFLTKMEITISAILGELGSRSLSFLVDKFLSRTATPTEEERLNNLQRLLLRIGVIVEEAEERCITNQAMLHQLSVLKKEMYRGYYTLDMCRCRAFRGENTKDPQVSHAFALSRFNPAKRVCFCSGSSQSVKELQQVLQSLEAIVADVNEFVVFITSCPPLYRQPYSMHLVLGKCMFGRQMEMERVINFLLQPEGSHGTEKPAVLPIIGPRRVGKSTLIEHACNHEWVRNHFSQTVFFARNDLEVDGSIATLGDAGVTRHQNHAIDGERVLVIVELDGNRYSERLDDNISKGLLRRLYSAYKSRILPPGSKIIIASQSDKIANFGTTLPLRLEPLTREAFWYFFKVRTFGSTDVADHPKLAPIAMEMARECEGCFLAASVFSELLRSNMNTHSWSLALSIYREFKQGNCTGDQAYPAWDQRSGAGAESVVVLDGYQTGVGIAPAAHGEAELAPKVSVLDVLFRRARPRGRFDAFAWKSSIPPHYGYVFSCEIRRQKGTVAKN